MPPQNPNTRHDARPLTVCAYCDDTTAEMVAGIGGLCIMHALLWHAAAEESGIALAGLPECEPLPADEDTTPGARLPDGREWTPPLWWDDDEE